MAAYKLRVKGHPELVCVKNDKVLALNEEIVNEGEESKFGDYRKKTDVLDPNYRSSLEIPGKDLYFKNKEGELTKLVPQSFLDALWVVKPHATIHLHKLNIYREGDFFKYHVDTPKADNFLGTLLWGLSDNYQGGELEVKTRERFHIGKDDLVYVDGHAPHQVLPVTSGVRLVVAFDVFGGNDEEEEEEDDEWADRWEDEIVRERRKVSAGTKYVAMALEKTYVRGCPGAEIYLENPGRKLTGFDLYLWEKFKDCEYCQVGEYIENMEYDDSWGSSCRYDAYDTERHESVEYGETHLIGKVTVEEDEEGGEYYAGNNYCDSYKYSGALVLVVRVEDFLRLTQV